MTAGDNVLRLVVVPGAARRGKRVPTLRHPKGGAAANRHLQKQWSRAFLLPPKPPDLYGAVELPHFLDRLNEPPQGGLARAPHEYLFLMSQEANRLEFLNRDNNLTSLPQESS